MHCSTPKYLINTRTRSLSLFTFIVRMSNRYYFPQISTTIREQKVIIRTGTGIDMIDNVTKHLSQSHEENKTFWRIRIFFRCGQFSVTRF